MSRFVLSVVLVLLSIPMIQAHPFHGSIAEAEWNPKTKKLEVSLWVHPVDLEKALRQRTKKPVDLDKTKDVDQLMHNWLKDVLTLTAGDKKKRNIVWVGKEIKLKGAWLYFEIPLEQGLEGVRIRHEAFLETLPDQINTITFRKGKTRRSISFTRERPERVFSWKPEKP